MLTFRHLDIAIKIGLGRDPRPAVPRMLKLHNKEPAEVYKRCNKCNKPLNKPNTDSYLSQRSNGELYYHINIKGTEKICACSKK